MPEAAEPGRLGICHALLRPILAFLPRPTEYFIADVIEIFQHAGGGLWPWKGQDRSLSTSIRQRSCCTSIYGTGAPFSLDVHKLRIIGGIL